MEDQNQSLDIRHYLKIIHKRRFTFVLAAAVIITAVTAVSYYMPKVYEASTTVSIERNYLNVLMRDIAVAAPVEERVQALSVVMTSRGMLLRVLAKLGVAPDEKDVASTEKVIKYYQKYTQIKFEASRSSRRDNMDLFTVTYRDKDPRFARDYVNDLVQQYVLDSHSKKQDQAVGANQFIYEQMELYKSKIDRVEAELGKRQKQRDVQAVSRLAKLKKRYDDLLTQYTEKHPEVIRVKAEIESTQEQVRQLQRAEEEDKGANGKSTKDLERDQEAYKKIYESLVASLGKSQVSAQVEVQDKADTFNILEPAVLPVEPVSRPRWQVILLGLLGGVAGGAGMVIVLEMLDRSIKSVSTIRELGIPVIAVIPQIETAAMAASKKRKDIALYGMAGMYVAAVVALAAVEYLK